MDDKIVQKYVIIDIPNREIKKLLENFSDIHL